MILTTKHPFLSSNKGTTVPSEVVATVEVNGRHLKIAANRPNVINTSYRAKKLGQVRGNGGRCKISSRGVYPVQVLEASAISTGC